MTRPGIDLPEHNTLIEAIRKSARGLSAGKGFSFLADGEEVTARLSHEELDRRARMIGAGIGHVTRPGDRVVLVFPPGLEFVEALFGCFYGGVVAVPVPWQRPGRANPQFGAIVENSAATVALTTRSVLKMQSRFVEGEPRLGPLRWMAIEEFEDGVGELPSEPRPDDLAFLQYTSGSTGTPKGVMLTHRALLANIDQMRRLLGLDPQKVGVCWLPPFHDMGLIGNILQTVHSGMDLVMMPPVAFVQSPVRWLRAISRFGAYVSGGPNFAFELCAKAIAPQDRDGLDLRSWEVAYVGAEPVSPGTLDRFMGAFADYGFRRRTFYPCFGLAEATLMVSGGDRSAEPVVRRVRRDDLTGGQVVPAAGADAHDGTETQSLSGCGRAVPGLTVQIVDPETGVPARAGRVGEVWVAGPSVGLGYWGRTAETEQSFRARLPGFDGLEFLRTGDLGFLDGDELFVSGRLKDVIIVRGKNHFPHDIEEVVAACHPEIKLGGVVAFGVESDGETRLELLCEVSRHSREDETAKLVDAIRRAVSEQLGLEVHSITLVRALSLPKTSSGKSRRLESRRLSLAGELAVVHRWLARELAPTHRVDTSAPAQMGRREIREWLVTRIARYMNTSEGRISTTEPFATFGLDSVSMVTISAELGDLLGSTLSPTLLYDAPTIEALSAALVREEAGAEAIHPHRAKGEPIAIIGGGCRFPGSNSLEGFWETLREGRDEVGTAPESRKWSRPPGVIASPAGGFLPEVDRFDALFFGISPREAAFIDPQHRLLLEVAWEALENAGLAADKLPSRNVGVFAGITGSDYGRMLARGPGLDDAYWGTGNAASMAAGRVSYHLDLTGPSLTVDTACSSSLVAIHLAVRSLRDGECELALAGGVNLMLSPEVSVALTTAQMLSRSGRCRTFDARADGYVRGEGCGVVVLKLLADAIRDGDRVMGVIRGSAMNQDGKSNGITAPNGASQTKLIRSALRDAHVAPGEIGYVEAHGSGTILGDPIEVDALKAALSEGSQPCAIGTVKTNLGHLEAAAGVAGLLKVALQLDRGQVAPHLHFESTNPHIHLEGTRFFIPERLRHWGSAEDGARLAGVSSFGFGGTNAHVILESPPTPAPTTTSRPDHLLAISARSDTALKRLASQYLDRLSTPLTPPEIADLCHTANVGRVHFQHRLAARATSADGFRQALAAYLSGTRTDGLHVGEPRRGAGPQVAFLFTGQGSQHVRMARSLYATCSTFRAAVDHCDAILRGRGEPPVATAFSVQCNGNVLARPACPQVTLFVLQYALTQTWRAWGVVPAAVMGHSLGEYAASCAAGVFTVEDGLRLVAGRARLMTSLCQPGEMAAVFTSHDVVLKHIASMSGSLSIAAINGPGNVVISGSRESVHAAREEFNRQGISSQSIDVALAYHSPLIEPALERFRDLAAGVRFAAPSIPLVSNLSGSPAADDVRDASYWCRHAREPVQFLDGVRNLHASGIDLFVEIGPTSTLSALAQIALPAGSAAFLPSLRKGREDWPVLLDSLGAVYTKGLAIDWAAFDAGEARRKVALPTYPFERERHWIDGQSADSHDKVAAPVVLPPDPFRTTWELRTRWDHEVDCSPAPDLVSPVEIAGGLERLADGLFNDRNPARRPDQKADFDRLAAGYAVGALAELGWEPELSERITVDSLAEKLRVPLRFHRFFGRIVQILAEEGYLERSGLGWRVVTLPDPVDMPTLLVTTLNRHPEWVGELTLAGRCGESLGRVLRGGIDPLEILFPGGSATLLEGLYEDSPVARLSNRVVADAIVHAVDQYPVDRTVRILELGAGTGGTTSHILPRLAAGRCEYVFSDISALFTGRAREKFSAYDFVEYRVLDLEGDPEASGLASHQFDVILAANVLHATSVLRRTLAGVRRLLAPSGLLVLLEGTGPQRLPDLVFGMAEGWWKFTDTDLRGAHPLLPRRAWVELLRGEGFAEAAALPTIGEEAGEPDQAIILARGPAIVNRPGSQRRSAGTSKRGGLGWLIFSDGAVGRSLAEHLRAAGEPCAMIEPGTAYCRIEPGRFAIHSDSKDDYVRLFRSAREELDRPQLGVIHLWGLAPAASLGEALSLSVGTALHLDGVDTAIDQLWLVTREGTAAGGASDTVLPAQSMLWSLGQSLQVRRPGKVTKLVDLDSRTAPEFSASRLASEILGPDSEDALAFRSNRRLGTSVAKLPKTGQPGPAPSSGLVLGGIASAPDGPSLQELQAANPDVRHKLLEEILRSELGHVLSLAPDQIDRDLPINSFGLDSLIAIQLKNRIEVRTGVSLSISTMLEGLSVVQISSKMDEEFVTRDGKSLESFTSSNGNGQESRVGAARIRPASSHGLSTLDQMVADLDWLTDSELDPLLDDLIGPDGFDEDENNHNGSS